MFGACWNRAATMIRESREHMSVREMGGGEDEGLIMSDRATWFGLTMPG
jgi:hypothetical protein